MASGWASDDAVNQQIESAMLYNRRGSKDSQLR